MKHIFFIIMSLCCTASFAASSADCSRKAIDGAIALEKVSSPGNNPQVMRVDIVQNIKTAPPELYIVTLHGRTNSRIYHMTMANSDNCRIVNVGTAF